VLADLPVTTARKLSVPLQSGLRPPRGRIGNAVDPCDGRERSTMEGTGQRSGRVTNHLKQSICLIYSVTGHVRLSD